MVQVRIIKRQGRVFKNTLGEINESDFENYGIGENITMLHRTNVKIGNDWHSILNKELELVK